MPPKDKFQIKIDSLLKEKSDYLKHSERPSITDVEKGNVLALIEDIDNEIADLERMRNEAQEAATKEPVPSKRQYKKKEPQEPQQKTAPSFSYDVDSLINEQRELAKKRINNN